MLKLENVFAGYLKGNNIIKNINLSVKFQEVVSLIGQNGAGKSTLAKAIINLVPYISGNIFFNEQLISGDTTHEIVKKSLNFCLQGGRIFPHLTIEENLMFSATGMKRKDFVYRREILSNYFDLFTKSEQVRLNMQASYLSGGEQHQLALAMALMKKPTFLILDEPSAGLSPSNVKRLYEILKLIKVEERISILLIEQNVEFAVQFSDKICIIKDGRLVSETKSSELNGIKKIESFFFENI